MTPLCRGVFVSFLLELFVDDVETECVSCPLHLGDQVSNLLLGLDLLLEVLALDEVSQLSVSVRVGHLVHLEQRLVDFLLEFERGLDGAECRVPVVCLGLGDVLEDDASAPHVLVLDELLGVLTLLVRVLPEPLGEPVQGNVVAVKVGGHGHVDVAGVELHVDLLVDQSLGVGVEVGADLGHLDVSEGNWEVDQKEIDVIEV